MYQDKTLVCRDCGAEFIWSAGEQEFFAQKGFDKPPTRCPEDRKKRRTEKEGGGGRPASGPKTLYPIVCANCGKAGEVPFQPKSANVLCAECFRNRAGQTGSTPAAPGSVAPVVTNELASTDTTTTEAAVPADDQDQTASQTDGPTDEAPASPELVDTAPAEPAAGPTDEPTA